MRRHGRMWSLAVSTLMAAAACGGGEGDNDVPRATVGTMATSSSTMPAYAEATTSSTEPLSREDFLRRKVVDLFAIRSDLLQHPDPARLTEWVSPNCECFAVEQSILQEFSANGYRLTGDSEQILGVVIEQDDVNFVSLTVVWQGDDVHVVDATNAIVRPRPGFPARGAGIDLAMDIQARWIVHGIVDLPQLSPDRIREITEAGTP